MSDQPAEPHTTIDQSGQIVHGHQTNVAGDLNTTWPRVATTAALVVLLVFTLILIDLATNQVERLSGLSLQALLGTAAVIAAFTWSLAIWILWAAPPHHVRLHQRRKSQLTPPQHRFTGRPRHLAKAIAIGLPILFIIISVAYYTWRILPARYTTILLADFIAPGGTDEALVTQTLATELEKTLAPFPTLRVKHLHQVIDPDGGSEAAKRIGALPQHKATIVIWGNYTIVAGDPEVHLHFDIVQPTDTYLKSGFSASYGPSQISQLLQIEQPTMFDFKVSLGAYLGHMSAFTVGLTLYNANRHNDAIQLFETAARAIDRPLVADFALAIRFYRGTNYLSLLRIKDAESDFLALLPAAQNKPIQTASFTLATLGNLGLIAMEKGNYTAAKRYLAHALTMSTDLGDLDSQSISLNNLSLVAGSQGDYVAAKRYLDRVLTIDTKSGNQAGQAAILGNLGVIAREQGDYKMAQDYHKQALAIHIALGDLAGQAQAIDNLGVIAREQGNYELAERYHEQARTMNSDLGIPPSQAAALVNLGLVAREQGDYVVSKQYLDQALTIYTKLDDLSGQATALGNLGVLATEQSDYVIAKRYLEQALTIDTDIGNRLGQARALGNLGNILFNQGDYEAAKRYHEQALNIHTQLGSLPGQAQNLSNLGLVAKEQHDYVTAKRYHEQALTIYDKLDNRLGQAQNLGNLGLLAKVQGDYVTATGLLEQSLTIHTDLGNRLGQANQLGNLGIIAFQQGDYVSTKHNLEKSLTIHTDLSNRLGQAQGSEILGILALVTRDYTTARDYLDHSAALYQSMGLPIPPNVQSGLSDLNAQQKATE